MPTSWDSRVRAVVVRVVRVARLGYGLHLLV